MQTFLKADKLNGQTIMRPITTGPDGVNYQNKGVFFMPSIKVGTPKVVPLEALVEGALADLISVSDATGDPVIKAQAVLFKKKLKDHQSLWMYRAAMNERERIKNILKNNGFKNVDEVIK